MYDWNNLSKRFAGVVADMRTTEQDKKWHAEGNVAIHTAMVMDELLKNKDFALLSEEDKMLISLAAFFHDLGKPKTTKTEEETGDIISPNHSRISEKDFRLMCMKGELPELNFMQREQVSMLIRYHGFPVHFWKKRDMEREVVKKAEEVRTDLLYILAIVDGRGRIVTGGSTIEENEMGIDVFQEECINQDVYGNKREFETDKEKTYFFHTGKKYTPFEQEAATMYLICGIAGAGKDTYIQKELPELPVISLDNMRRERKVSHGDKKETGRIRQDATKLAKIYMARKEDFVWNATNISKDLRKKLLDLAYSYKANVEIIYHNLSRKPRSLRRG